VSVAVSRGEIDAEMARALPAFGEVTRVQPLLKGHGLLSGLLYFKNTDQAAMLADYRQRVEPWLAAGA
jgi:hypothetical protein